MAFNSAGTTYWLAPGTHTIGTGQYSQIIPKDNSTFIGAPGAVLDGQGLNAYAFTQHAINVRIAYLTIQNFISPRDEGVVNHDYAAGWVIDHNTIQYNRGAGVFLGDNNQLRYNCLKANGQYGFQGFGNTMVFDHNEIVGNNTDDWETKVPGCGCTGGGKFWDAQHATLTSNWVHGNRSVGLWADTNDLDFVFDGNYIENNDGMGLMYEISYNAVIRNNTFNHNAVKSGLSNSFPAGAIYLSESGGDSRVSSTTTGTANLDISGNNFVNNWDGVVLWENADRFCGSPANTSSGYCTLVNPQANLTTCNDPAAGGSINVTPYRSDCRWKTQNVKVHNNVFSFDPTAVGCTTGMCGRNGVFSNYGSYPSWSPYMGYVVEDAITFNQANLWSANTYTGPWKFTVHDQSSNVGFTTWQAAPYGQDAGSTFNGKGSTTTTSPSSTTTTTAPSPTTTTTAPPPTAGNALNADTAGLEGSIGAWAPWFSAAPSRSSMSAHTGSYSLEVDVSAPYGWGVQLNNYPGFPTAAGNKTISFWGRLAAGTTTGATMSVAWKDASGATLKTDSVSIPSLGASWQLTTAAVVAPAGTTTAWVTLGGNAAAGTTLLLDDFAVSG